jgi:hypothetical protein
LLAELIVTVLGLLQVWIPWLLRSRQRVEGG